LPCHVRRYLASALVERANVEGLDVHVNYNIITTGSRTLKFAKGDNATYGVRHEELRLAAVTDYMSFAGFYCSATCEETAEEGGQLKIALRKLLPRLVRIYPYGAY